MTRNSLSLRVRVNSLRIDKLYAALSKPPSIESKTAVCKPPLLEADDAFIL
jgi:hypothetical protein